MSKYTNIMQKISKSKGNTFISVIAEKALDKIQC
jgi:hypothetical protein